MRVVIFAALAVALALAACTPPADHAPATFSPPVDTECTTGMAFVHSYSAIAARYDPQVEQDRSQLAATEAYPALANAKASVTGQGLGRHALI